MSSPPAGPGRQSASQSPRHSDTAYHLAREWLDDEHQNDEDEEDMDYEPESERSEDIEYFDDAESHATDEAIRQGLFGALIFLDLTRSCSVEKADNQCT